MTFDSLLQRIQEASREESGDEGIVSFIHRMWASDTATAAADSAESWLWERVVVAAAGTDRPWLGGAAAIQGAIRHLLLRAGHAATSAPERIFAFCASESGGNHPRAIQSTLSGPESGPRTLQGSKRWATLSPLASHLVVVASVGADEHRNRLRAVLVPTQRAGVFIEEMTIPGGSQANLRLPHGLIMLEDVQISEADLLPGDGYSSYLKPFRTIEDLYSAGARAASMLSSAFRHRVTSSTVERLISLLASLDVAMSEDLDAPSSHLLVSAAESSLPELGRRVVARMPAETASWWTAAGEVQIATRAKDVRRERALGRLLGE